MPQPDDVEIMLPSAQDVKQPTRPKVMQVMGPGLITGASDDDPSGIATYSQVGARYGYGLVWTLLLSYPLMAAIQEISARIGRVTGRGIAANMKRHNPLWLTQAIIALLLVANIINLGADLGAMGAAVQLLIAGPVLLYVALFGLLSAGLEIFVRYARYVSLLKWLCLALLSYVACALAVDVPWGHVMHEMVLPPLSGKPDYIMAIVAVLGTTISPYLFFWQAEQEVEDEHEQHGAKPLMRSPEQAPGEFRRIRLDTCIGMAISNLIAFFIMVTAAATLNAHGITNIDTSAQAAEALRHIAGRFTFVVFAAGIIGTGMLTLPVLAGSAAYATGEIFAWRVGLARKPARARKFYGAVAAATLIGAGLNFSPINPIKALYWSAVINGVAAVPIMVMMMRLATNRAVMGEFTLPKGLKLLGWLATGAMAAAAVAMVVGWFLPDNPG